MMFRTAAMSVLALGLATVAGCNCCGQDDKPASTQAAATQPAAQPAAQSAQQTQPSMSMKPVTDADGNLDVVNGYCPIASDDEIWQKKRKPELTRIWRGQAVGFCCDHCPSKWDALSAEDKDAKLAAVMKKVD